MYLSVELALSAAAAWLGSRRALAGVGGMLGFFLLKSRHEERLLAQRYPDYITYRQRVRGRIIPWLL